MAVPEQSTVRRDLARGVLYGYVDTEWVKEFAEPRLFRLPRVQTAARAISGDSDPTDDELAEAFTSEVRNAINEIGSLQYRRLLAIVLGLEPDFAAGQEELAKIPPDIKIDGDMPLQERRAIAGRLFRGGKRQVTWGCIRTHHEPKALRQLAELLAREPS